MEEDGEERRKERDGDELMPLAVAVFAIYLLVG